MTRIPSKRSSSGAWSRDSSAAEATQRSQRSNASSLAGSLQSLSLDTSVTPPVHNAATQNRPRRTSPAPAEQATAQLRIRAVSLQKTSTPPRSSTGSGHSARDQPSDAAAAVAAPPGARRSCSRSLSPEAFTRDRALALGPTSLLQYVLRPEDDPSGSGSSGSDCLDDAQLPSPGCERSAAAHAEQEHHAADVTTKTPYHAAGVTTKTPHRAMCEDERLQSAGRDGGMTAQPELSAAEIAAECRALRARLSSAPEPNAPLTE